MSKVDCHCPHRVKKSALAEKSMGNEMLIFQTNDTHRVLPKVNESVALVFSQIASKDQRHQILGQLS